MRLLLIEDDQILGNAIQTGLNASGNAVDWVEDAESGEHALRAEEYDALILDLTLPGKDGLVLLSEIRQSGNQLPVLILTARDAIPDRVVTIQLILP
ncbi:MAG: hypothetical protein B0D96_13290 [Candidatus Sedimenticola endophacoides]|uniref:Response regulatory domain-containing protein n=1 Tax=Candidatus Sedimenticola endophacoides TaxID=2548426 RepID=A0A657Q681_9GAMM|nr:MAG: hypothetical protein B0D94_00540 [Candidatus Sedimenticola endophacoides]OQX32657.1 MAG: hypothetical protein B0D96_13290 [Candidatus Sedimenticola endophacoides]OQX36607.1 MAG: hypothetical protein B0D84_01335 [Candidatus Sedimenticola endophacoides]OQX42802.1 MAG: hypothetical protein B0D89_00515 [Candidatus Sedimenticola endophacoides]OQX43462.1 MAG: hypothetical protein B0D83_01335 [Candidatus Sedimenticola endophacoides]